MASGHVKGIVPELAANARPAYRQRISTLTWYWSESLSHRPGVR